MLVTIPKCGTVVYQVIDYCNCLISCACMPCVYSITVAFIVQTVGDTSRLEVDPVTGVVRIVPGNTWDYETGQRSFSLTVRATDNPNGMPQLSVSLQYQFQFQQLLLFVNPLS